VLFPFSFAWARQTVRVGVTDGPQAEIMQQVKKIAAAGHDLDLEIVPFREDEPINRALSSRRLDAASFQDGVALEAEIKRYGYPLLPAALTVTLPMGLYSRKARTVKALVPGASVALPRERGAVARALILLHNYGVIQLREDCGLQATLRDISKNPRKLRFVKLPAGRLAKKLDQVSLAAIDYPKAVQAGLYPARDGIGMEDGRSPYAGVLAIRAADKGEPWVKSLIAAYHSEEIKRFILVRYQDSVRRPW
jgi:YaeC family lipoprotein